jgi:hypothetical protein
VAHPVHQLAQRGSSIGRQLVAGVPQIVEMDHGQLGGSQSGEPDTLPKVPPQRHAFRAREHQGFIVGLDQPGHVLPDNRHDRSR